jgi:nicotinamidase-related amidase
VPILVPASTALVLIDLQQGVLANHLSPIDAPTLTVRSIALAERFRGAGALVVLVHVAFSPDGADLLSQPVDQPMRRPQGGFPASWSELVAGLEQPGDLRITKRQWGAFHGTELDLQLRRRGVRTLVLGGVATHIGVDTTARQAFERGYELLIGTDISSSTLIEGHEMSMKLILPRLGRLVASSDLEFEPASAT